MMLMLQSSVASPIFGKMSYRKRLDVTCRGVRQIVDSGAIFNSVGSGVGLFV